MGLESIVTNHNMYKGLLPFQNIIIIIIIIILLLYTLQILFPFKSTLRLFHIPNLPHISFWKRDLN